MMSKRSLPREMRSMKDLTSSSITRNILQMAVPIAAGMFFQTLYFLIDLYFVAGLGDAARYRRD